MPGTAEKTQGDGGDFGRLRRPRAVVLVVVGIILLAGGVVGAASAGLLGGGSGTVGNDEFARSEAVDGLRMTGTTIGATADADEIAAGVAPSGQVVWYSWVAPATAWAHVTPADATAGPTPVIGVYRGEAIDGLEAVVEPDHDGAGGASIPAVADRTYRIAVITETGTDFDLLINQPTAAGLANDEPHGAMDIGGAVDAASESGGEEVITIDSLAGATAAEGEAAERSVWFSWTPLADGGNATLSVRSLDGDDHDAYRLAVFEADLEPEHPAITPDLLLPSPDATGAAISGRAGATYLISLDGPAGFYRLAVAASGVSPALDDVPPVVDCEAPAGTWSSAAELSVRCTATDAGVGLADPADAEFLLRVDALEETESDDLVSEIRPVCDLSGNCTDAGPIRGLKSDRKGPEATCDEPAASWTATAPVVVCSFEDAGSGLADPADAERSFTVAVLDDVEGPVEVPGGEVCDAAGNCTEVGPFGPVDVDVVAPKVTCAPPPTEPSSSEVEIICFATDGGSGLADAERAQIALTTSVGEGAVDLAASTDSVEVCDIAGNCSTAGPFDDLRVDRSPPSVACVPGDGRPTDDWRSAPFDIDCTITDVGVGLATGTPSSLVLRATTLAGTSSSEVVAAPDDVTEVCDGAGNCTPVEPITGLRIDRRPPTVTCESAGDAWRPSPASIACDVDDGGGSGTEGAGSVTLTASVADGTHGTADTNSMEVCDRAGNCSTAGPIRDLRLDAAPPVITCGDPAAAYRVEARITCRASDTGSGLADGGDGTFILVTSVGEGLSDPAAETDSRRVCDRVGRCATAGPLTVSVDRTGPAGDGPAISVPDRLTVLSAFDPAGPTPVPYDMPEAPEADEIRCRTESGAVFGLDRSTVRCEAVGPMGTTLASFPLIVKPLPSLGSTGAATSGGAWRAVGVGFAPGRNVEVRIGDRVVTEVAADDEGHVVAPFTIPDDLPSGDHLLVVAGVDEEGDPIMVVGPLNAAVPGDGEEPPTEVPEDAPNLPEDPPVVPPDPPVDPADPPDDTSDPKDDPGDPKGDPGDPKDPGGQRDPSGPDGPAGGAAPAGSDHGDGPRPRIGPVPLPRTGIEITGLVLVGAGLIVGGYWIRRRSGTGS